MSRARPINGLWFDTQKNNQKATVQQLELLAATEDVPIDDILDEGLRQWEIIERLRVALGEGAVPQDVMERRRAAKVAAAQAPECRICTEFGWKCEGAITKHHFIPRWMMLQLENYQAYAARTRCCIPICIGRHRDLHLRGDTDTPKSIAQFLNVEEKAFAQKLMDELKDQHPAIFDLLAGGDENSYEYILVRDYNMGAFRKAQVSEVSSSLSSLRTA